MSMIIKRVGLERNLGRDAIINTNYGEVSGELYRVSEQLSVYKVSGGGFHENENPTIGHGSRIKIADKNGVMREYRVDFGEDY